MNVVENGHARVHSVGLNQSDQWFKCNWCIGQFSPKSICLYYILKKRITAYQKHLIWILKQNHWFWQVHSSTRVWSIGTNFVGQAGIPMLKLRANCGDIHMTAVKIISRTMPYQGAHTLRASLSPMWATQLSPATIQPSRNSTEMCLTTISICRLQLLASLPVSQQVVIY